MRSRSLGGNTFSSLIQRLGRIWSYCVIRHGRLYLDRRCAAFLINVSGGEHLSLALRQPCLIVSNHVLIRAENAPLGLLTQTRILTLLNQPPDSFILRRVVRETTGLALHVVAKSDRGWWSPRPLVKFLQKRLGQPFGKGLMEGMEFIPIEHNPDCFHRTFLQSAAGPIGRRLPILIFPGRICDGADACYDSLVGSDSLASAILPGAAHLSRKFSLPIIPIFIQGGDSWRPQKPTCVLIGPAIHTEGMSKAGINQAIITQMHHLAFD